MESKTCGRCVSRNNPKPGRMFVEVYLQSCEECKDSGAKSCEDCWIQKEWTCIVCGHVVPEPRIRKRNLPGKTV